nr:hypothetical protein [Tanacetum cinerariifolium]
MAQNDLVEFVEEYGISLCYDPKLPEPDQIALDAPGDVFDLFRCHFPLLNPFGVARVTTFNVACKAYGGKAMVPLFRAFLNLGPAGDWLNFQKSPGSDIPTHFSNSMSNIPHWISEFIFVKETFNFDICLGQITKPIEMAFRNSMKKPSQSPSFSLSPADQLVNVGKGVAGLKLAVVGENVTVQSVNVTEGLNKMRSISKSLEEEAIVVKVASKKKNSRLQGG